MIASATLANIVIAKPIAAERPASWVPTPSSARLAAPPADSLRKLRRSSAWALSPLRICCLPIPVLIKRWINYDAKKWPFAKLRDKRHPLFFLLPRSEEHTSELQSLMRISYAVFCLKKKNTKNKKQ